MNEAPDNLECKTLYRPVGIRELELIFRSGMKKFPPRLPEQPIFYPVLNREYAVQIARDWNTKPRTSGYGFVLRFDVRKEYLRQFAVETVGAKEHQELWVPADKLTEFNENIVGTIEVLEFFRGEGADIEIDSAKLVPTKWLTENNPERQTLYTGRHCMLRSVNGWEYVERSNNSGIVAILAITAENKLLLVQQFRPPLGKMVVELPAGLAGDIGGVENESFANAAHRELVEETGYRAQHMERIVEGPVSAGISTEVITFFRAENLTKIAKGGDASENIQVFEVPLTELDEWLESKGKEGCLVDYKVYAALYFELRRKLK